MCTVLFILFVPVAAVVCIGHKWHTVVKHNIDSVQHTTQSETLQVGF